jgi:hypothetical protein
LESLLYRARRTRSAATDITEAISVLHFQHNLPPSSGAV